MPCWGGGSPRTSRARIPISWHDIGRTISGIDPEGYAGCCEAIAAMDLRSGLPGITAQTLVVSGRQDPSIPPEHGEAIAAAVPGARFTVLDPAAHLASVERANTVTSLIAEHLAGASVGAGA